MNIHIKALNLSTITTIIFIGIVTIWSELSKPFKIFLAGITGHHWVTKGVLSLILFVVLYYIFSRRPEGKIDIGKESMRVVWTVILVGLIIFGFYIWHFFS